MDKFQAEKQLVRDYYLALDAADGDAITSVLDQHIATNYIWRGYHPFHEQHSANTVSEVFWQPFRQKHTSQNNIGADCREPRNTARQWHVSASRGGPR